MFVYCINIYQHIKKISIQISLNADFQLFSTDFILKLRSLEFYHPHE